ncbi:MAG: 2OG-Fe(II) oxygenase [Ferruginibacter sp.]
MYNQFDLLIDSYLDHNVGFDAGFLNKHLSDGLQQHLLQLQEDNQMITAGIGNDRLKDDGQKMRGDSIYWMDKKHTNVFEQEFLTLVEEFIRHLNRTCYAGINGYEFHYAIYEKGTAYKRHKDQFKNDDTRKFSLINYLNDDWLETDGGELMLFQNNNIERIAPHAQSAVFFKSDEMEHEVNCSSRTRMSITGWLKRN